MILNPKVDEYCFRYAILIGLLIASNPRDEINQYKGYSHKLVLGQLQNTKFILFSVPYLSQT